jgi:hypothetical protein
VGEGRLSPTYLIDRYTLARRRATVVVAIEEWERKVHRAANLTDFFANSPLRASELEIYRVIDEPREIDL